MSCSPSRAETSNRFWTNEPLGLEGGNAEARRRKENARKRPEFGVRPSGRSDPVYAEARREREKAKTRKGESRERRTGGGGFELAILGKGTNQPTRRLHPGPPLAMRQVSVGEGTADCADGRRFTEVGDEGGFQIAIERKPNSNLEGNGHHGGAESTKVEPGVLPPCLRGDTVWVRFRAVRGPNLSNLFNHR